MPHRKIPEPAPSVPQESLNVEEITDHLLDSAKGFWDTDPMQAQEFAQKALSLARNAGSVQGMARSLFQLAIPQRDALKAEERIRMLLESASYFEQLGLPGDACYCFRYIAETYADNSDYRDAVEALEKASFCARTAGDIVSQGEIYNAMGDAYRALNQFHQAVEQHLKALDVFEITGSREMLSETYLLLGESYMGMNERDSAFSYFDKSLSLAEEAKDAALQARPSGGLALIFTELKEYDKALIYFFKAIDLANSLGDLLLKTDLLKNTSRVYLERGENEKAISFLNEALEIAEAHPFKYPRHEIHRMLSEAWSRTGNFDKAYFHLNNYFTDFEKIKRQELHSLARGLELKSEKEYRQKAQHMAEQASGLKDRFMLNISHEIRTPLNGVIGMADLLSGTHPTPEQQEYINTIKLSAGNLIHTINDIIEYNNIQSGSLRLRNEDVNVGQLVENIANHYQQEAASKGIRFTYTSDERIPQGLIGDQRRIRQILEKLLDNAIRYTSRGTVQLEAGLIDSKPEKPLILFTVSDTGTGISPEKLETIFELQTPADEQHYQTGSGLGISLALVKQLTALLGGTIQVTSNKGSGTIFKIAIPLTSLNASDLSGNKMNGRKKGKETAAIRILMVEDNKVNQFLGQKLLTKMGFSVQLSSNASEAVDALQQDTFDVILMDVQMPVMTGYELTELIRNQLPAPVKNIPIIALTAYASLQEREKALACGMNDYVTKPYSPEELKSVLMRVVEQSREQRGSAKAANEVRQEEVSNTVTKLLELFNDNKEDVISLLNMLIVQIPQLLQEAEQHISGSDWVSSFQSFHKIRSSINLLKITTLRHKISELEEFSKDRIHAARIPQLFDDFKSACQRTVGFLKEEVVKLRRH
ncbi:MAG TPA: response regulator [Bacteroidia bacterium]|nr:response regulator [Bacteroidia bacterium]